MSYLVREVYHESVNRTTLVKERLAFIIADDESSLPIDTSDMVYVMGSEALTIDTGNKYIKNSSGNWVLQPNNMWQNVYTKVEVDDIVTRIDSDITDVENDVSDLHTTVAKIIDTGAKNIVNASSGSGTRFVNIPIILAPGKYHIYFGDITSTDVDATTCQCVAFASDNSDASNYLQLQRVSGVNGVLTVTKTTSYVRLYASNTYANGAGDTVTFADAMICTELDWEMSPTYTPYCPTLYELYQLVKSYHP